MCQVMVQAVLVVVYRTYLLAAHAVTVDSLWFYMLMIVSALFVAYFAVHATLFANVSAAVGTCVYRQKLCVA